MKSVRTDYVKYIINKNGQDAPLKKKYGETNTQHLKTKKFTRQTKQLFYKYFIISNLIKNRKIEFEDKNK